jgi:iron-sulfur cluster assembly protein
MKTYEKAIQVDWADFPINLSDVSVTVIEKALKNKNRNNKILRVSVKGGGCSGFKYRLNFVTDIFCNDICCHYNKNICFVIDINTYSCIKNTTIDFANTETGSGFVFNNPNSLDACNGCD